MQKELHHILNLSKVSIIVPIYNIEKYLNKCVDSIIAQSYSNLEIILVDDGSPDESGAICDRYSEQDNRIVVIHKENGGLSDARNAGLDVATGEYITFIDSDDWYAIDAIEVLLNLMLQKNADIACMRNASVSCDYSTVEQVPDDGKTELVSSSEMVKRLCEKTISTSVCNKLFKARLWKSIRFQKGRLNEDYLALCEILMDDPTSVLIDYPGYFYYVRSDSLTHSEAAKVKPVHDAILNALELKHKAEQKRPELCQYFARMALYQTRTILFIIPARKAFEPEQKKTITQCLKECWRSIIPSTLKPTDKMILLAACFSPMTVSFLLRKISCMRKQR